MRSFRKVKRAKCILNARYVGRDEIQRIIKCDSELRVQQVHPEFKDVQYTKK
jgi:hypothetical protein